MIRELEARRIIKNVQKINLLARRPTKNRPIKEYNEIYYNGVYVELPDDVPLVGINFWKNTTNSQFISMIESINQPEKRFTKNEPYDDIIDDDNYDRKITIPIQGTQSPYFPDGWGKQYFPAGKRMNGKKHGGKPNIDKLKAWVENIKLAGMSQRELELEYMKVNKSENIPNWTDKHKESLIDSIAYLVARKIWYVGRRSGRETDVEWDERTRDMRPLKGTFGGDENMGIDYTSTEYVYRSGDNRQP